MPRRQSHSWFDDLDLRARADLLARPHGYLPDAVAAAIPKRARQLFRDEAQRKWQLRSAEAIHLEEERLRLTQWWRRLSSAARSALLRDRAHGVPADLHDAVSDLDPNRVPLGSNSDTSYQLPAIAAAYLEMVATDADPR